MSVIPLGLQLSAEVRNMSKLQLANRELERTIHNQEMLNKQAKLNSRYMDENTRRLEQARLQRMNNNYQMRAAAQDQAEVTARMQAAGRTMTAVGAGMTAAGAAGAFFMKRAVGESVKLEGAMNGIRIVSGMSDESLGKLNKNFKEMSIRLPGTAVDMARAADVAARMGVRGVEELSGVTENAVGLAVASGMQTKTAAEGLGSVFMAFRRGKSFIDPTTGAMMSMKDATASISSALMEMTFSTPGTAQELINVTKRSAAAAGQFGVTAAESLALAGALADLKLPPEMAGSAMLKFYQNMANKGPEMMKIAGINEAAWKKMTPIERIKGVLKGVNELGAAEKAGTAKTGTLQKAISMMGMKGIRTSVVMSALQAAMGKALDPKLAAKGVTRLDALLGKATKAAQEATKAKETMEKRLKSVGQQMAQLSAMVNMVMISLGDALLPVITAVVGVLRKLVNWFNSLSERTKNIIGLVIALGSAFLLLLGGLLLVGGAITMMLPGIMVFIESAFMATIAAEGWAGALGVLYAEALAPILAILAPIGIAILAVAAAVGTLYALFRLGVFDNFLNKLGEWKKTLGAVKQATADATKMTQEQFDLMDKWDMWDVAAGMEAAQKTSTAFWDSFGRGWQEGLEGGTSFKILVETIGMYLSETFEPIWAAIADLLNEIFGEMDSGMNKAIEDGYAFGYILSQIKYVLLALIPVIKIVLGPIASMIKTAINAVRLFVIAIKSIATFVEGVGKTIAGLLVGMLYGDWGGFFDGLKQMAYSFFMFFDAIIDSIAVAVSDGVRGMLELVDAVLPTSLTAIFDKIIDRIAGWWNTLRNKIKEWAGIDVGTEATVGAGAQTGAGATKRAEAAGGLVAKQNAKEAEKARKSTKAKKDVATKKPPRRTTPPTPAEREGAGMMTAAELAATLTGAFPKKLESQTNVKLVMGELQFGEAVAKVSKNLNSRLGQGTAPSS